ncbi:MAG: preprotein translocase subunit SecG [Candidatus Cloacimonetes bacterium]|nr:preprotein translocase subunit SecG [Candidatus Cloacimonadota bacterium]
MLFVFIMLHVIICLALIFIVLLQTGKGGLDSNFGGIASNALGTQGASDFLKKWTKILFIAFICSCILIGIQVRGGDGQRGFGLSRRNRISERAQREMENIPPAEEVPFEMQMDMPIEIHTDSPADDQMNAPIQIQLGPSSDSEPIIIEI